MVSRKRKRGTPHLAVAAITLLSGVAAALLGYAYIEKRLAEQRDTFGGDSVRVVEMPALLSVVVLQRDRFRGEKLTADDLTVLRVPTEGVTAEGVLEDPQQAIGQIALQDLYAGEWLLDRKLAGSEEDRWNRLLGPDMRAIRVPADSVTGLLGLLQPDDRIDLIAVFPDEDGKSVISRALEQNIAVLAVGQHRLPQSEEGKEGKAAESSDKSSSVTLEVSREQAERIALALEVGKVRLILRNRSDTEVVAGNGARLAELGKQESAPSHAPPRNRRVVQVISGDTVSSEVINP